MIGAVPVELLADARQHRLLAALLFGFLGLSGGLAFRWPLTRAP